MGGRVISRLTRADRCKALVTLANMLRRSCNYRLGISSDRIVMLDLDLDKARRHIDVFYEIHRWLRSLPSVYARWFEPPEVKLCIGVAQWLANLLRCTVLMFKTERGFHIYACKHLDSRMAVFASFERILSELRRREAELMRRVGWQLKVVEQYRKTAERSLRILRRVRAKHWVVGKVIAEKRALLTRLHTSRSLEDVRREVRREIDELMARYRELRHADPRMADQYHRQARFKAEALNEIAGARDVDEAIGMLEAGIENYEELRRAVRGAVDYWRERNREEYEMYRSQLNLLNQLSRELKKVRSWIRRIEERRWEPIEKRRVGLYWEDIYEIVLKTRERRDLPWQKALYATVDFLHAEVSLKRHYTTLRISAKPGKPYDIHFYAELTPIQL